MFEQITFIFDELDFITANLTTMIMLLTLLSLILANLARYAQAKLYGIPLKMVHQASIPDSFDIWITLICMLGFGLVLPWAIQSADIDLWLAAIIITTSCLLGTAMDKSTIGYEPKNQTGQITRTYNLKWVICALGILAFIYVHYMPQYDPNLLQRVLHIVALVFRGVYITFIVLTLTAQMVQKISGTKDIMTVEIDKTLYVIAMRHVHHYWVLIPCVMERGYPAGTIQFGSKNEQDMVDVISFTRGDFIVRDISLLEHQKTIHCYKSHELRGITPAKK